MQTKRLGGYPYKSTQRQDGYCSPASSHPSLFGIHPLCNPDKEKCDVIYNGEVILRSYKDTATDLWTLPVNAQPMQTALPRSAPMCDHALHSQYAPLHPGVNLATFMHSVKTHANGVKFAHQS